MNLRDYAAIVTGTLAMVVSAIILYMCTELQMQDVFYLSIMADFAGSIAVYVVTGGKKKRRKVRGVPIITLDRTEWEKGKAMHL